MSNRDPESGSERGQSDHLRYDSLVGACPRCGGRGRRGKRHWSPDGGICWKCGGSGIDPGDGVYLRPSGNQRPHASASSSFKTTGFKFACDQCGAKYTSEKHLQAHKDGRCTKGAAARPAPQTSSPDIGGKVIGGIVGFFLGGPIGAAIGAGLGHVVDSETAGSSEDRSRRSRPINKDMDDALGATLPDKVLSREREFDENDWQVAGCCGCPCSPGCDGDGSCCNCHGDR